MDEIIIVGGGIGGLALAAGLHKSGIKAKVLEAAPALKPIGAGILLAHNAQAALAHLGVLETVKPLGHQLFNGQGFTAHGTKLSTYAAAEKADPWLGIHRGRLHQALLSEADESQISLNAAVTTVEQAPDKVTLTTKTGEVFQARRVIAFDGIHSAIRQAVAPGVKPRYAGYTCWRGIATGYQVPDDRVFSETMGKGTRFGIVPIGPSETYWFACANAPENDTALGQQSASGLKARYYGNYHHPVSDLLDHTEQVYWNDIKDLPPPECLVYGNILLAGDAGHATTPNLGQGAGMALEDAATLYELIQRKLDWTTLGMRFEQLRLERTRWVVKRSWQMGKVGQSSNSLVMALRNSFMKATPPRVMQRQLRRLATVDFGT